MRVENSKVEKFKFVRRKTVTDTLIASLLDAGARVTYYKGGFISGSGVVFDKKYVRYFFLDVYFYILGIKKVKFEVVFIVLFVFRS